MVRYSEGGVGEFHFLAQMGTWNLVWMSYACWYLTLSHVASRWCHSTVWWSSVLWLCIFGSLVFSVQNDQHAWSTDIVMERIHIGPLYGFMLVDLGMHIRTTDFALYVVNVVNVSTIACHFIRHIVWTVFLFVTTCMTMLVLFYRLLHFTNSHVYITLHSTAL